MTKTNIKVLCLGCNKSFEVTHPAITSVSKLMKVTIDCQNCNQVIRVAEYHLVMEPLDTQMRRNLEPILGKEAADKAQFQSVELDDPSPFRGKDDGIRNPEPQVKPKTHSGLPNSPLAQHDELAALRDRLAKENG